MNPSAPPSSVQAVLPAGAPLRRRAAVPMPQLLHHLSKRIFWLGNITPDNPPGNRPRFPVVIGAVDRQSGLLRKETVGTIDDREAGDSLLAPFMAQEAD